LIVEADGGSRGNPGVAAYGALVRDAASGEVLAERAAYLGEAVTNNVAEYSGLVAGLEAASQIDPVAAVEVRMDSKLVVSQMSGAWKIKNPALADLAQAAHAALGGRKAKFTWVPRDRNQAADALANEAMDSRGQIARGVGGKAGEAGGAGSASSGGSPGAPHLGGDGLTGRAGGPSPVADAVRLAQAQASGAQRHPGVAGPVTTLILVRHGMSVATHREVFAGRALPGADLSQAGRLQAEAAAAELRRMLEAEWFGLEAPTALLTSPTARARQTAAAFERTFGLTAEVDDGFAEQDFGVWDGLTKDEVERDWPGGVEAWSLDAAFTPGGGESRAEVGRRVRAAVDRVVGARRGQTVLVASHAIATRAAIGAALGAPPEAWFAFRVAPASLNILRFWGLGHTEVVCSNRTAL
jgi:probable phosphoglycerate mutase